MNNLNVNEKIDYIVKQIKSYMKCTNGEKAVIGISGGKDSSIAAALCVKALGKENVIGILMPNGIDSLKDDSINDGIRICDYLGIKYHVIDIHKAYFEIQVGVENMLYCFNNCDMHASLSNQAKINLAPRIRMATLYAVSQSINGGRVINTTNACERFVGYGTLFGDTVGDFALLKNLTVSEIYEIGDALRLPYDLVHKIPSDGLTGKSDEDVLGVFYSEIETFMKTNGKVPECDWHEADPYFPGHFSKIYELHKNSEFKRQNINIPGPEF